MCRVVFHHLNGRDGDDEDGQKMLAAAFSYDHFVLRLCLYTTSKIRPHPQVQLALMLRSLNDEVASDVGGIPASAVPNAMVATATTTGGAPVDLADLVNAPAAAAKNQMQLRGYAFTQQQGSTTYWWNPRTTICATTVTSNKVPDNRNSNSALLRPAIVIRVRGAASQDAPGNG